LFFVVVVVLVVFGSEAAAICISSQLDVPEEDEKVKRW